MEYSDERHPDPEQVEENTTRERKNVENMKKLVSS